MSAAPQKVEPAPPSKAGVPPRSRAAIAFVWAFARDTWLSLDLRALGLFRIAFGISLIGNLIDHTRGGNLVAFFTNHGVLTNHLSLQAPIQPRPWSLLFAFSLPGEVAVAFLGIFAVYVLYLVGWKTRLMQILVLICFISLVNRNLLLQDGGSFVTTLLAIWTLFLPVGARYSVDRWLAGAKMNPEEGSAPASITAIAAARSRFWPADAPRHVSFVCLAILLQLAVIYGFNAANKTGASWKNGSAVHFILWQEGTNTALAGWLRFHEPRWLSPFLTYTTLLFEWTAPILALTPIAKTAARRVLIASMWAFHLGIAACMSLGPFAYVMMAFSILLLGPRDFALLEPRARALGRRLANVGWVAKTMPVLERFRARAARPAISEDPNPARSRRFRFARLFLREGAALVLFVAMLTEVTVANAAVPKPFRIEERPEWMSEVLFYLRIYQTWGMFSSDPPFGSGTVVVDALLADGTHIDPLTGKPPDLDAPLHGPWGQGHDWSEYLFYYPWDRHRAYRDGLRDYVARQDEDQGWPPQKRIRSFNLYWVSATSPPLGGTAPYDLKREILLTYVARH